MAVTKTTEQDERTRLEGKIFQFHEANKELYKAQPELKAAYKEITEAVKGVKDVRAAGGYFGILEAMNRDLPDLQEKWKGSGKEKDMMADYASALTRVKDAVKGGKGYDAALEPYKEFSDKWMKDGFVEPAAKPKEKVLYDALTGKPIKGEAIEMEVYPKGLSNAEYDAKAGMFKSEQTLYFATKENALEYIKVSQAADPDIGFKYCTEKGCTNVASVNEQRKMDEESSGRKPEDTKPKVPEQKPPVDGAQRPAFASDGKVYEAKTPQAALELMKSTGADYMMLVVRGQNYDTKGADGKPVAGYMWCGPCRAYEPSVFQMAANMKGSNVLTVVGRIPIDSYENWQGPFTASFTVGTKTIRVQEVPFTLVIDKAGNVLQNGGQISETRLRQMTGN